MLKSFWVFLKNWGNEVDYKKLTEVFPFKFFSEYQDIFIDFLWKTAFGIGASWKLSFVQINAEIIA